MSFLFFVLTLAAGTTLLKLGAAHAMVTVLWWLVGTLGAVIAALLGWIAALYRRRC